MSKSAVLKTVERLDLDATKRLLESKPSLLTVTDGRGRNLLYLACSASTAKLAISHRRQLRFVEFLLKRGFEIDRPAGRDACTPLFFAIARARNLPLVRLLIDRGARPTSAPGGGLFAAGWWEDLVTLKLLIRSGAPIDAAVGVTPFLACWCWRRFEAA